MGRAGTLHDVEHLGDGVYVGHDSFQFWVCAESQYGWECVALEAQAIDQLKNYVRKVHVR